MSESNSSAKSGGVGFLGLLTIAFVVLKLVGTIDWSWWWVLSPLWVFPAIAVIVLIASVLFSVFKK